MNPYQRINLDPIKNDILFIEIRGKLKQEEQRLLSIIHNCLDEDSVREKALADYAEASLTLGKIRTLLVFFDIQVTETR